MSIDERIKCPYDWFCGKSFVINSLPEYDREFLKEAIQKGMEFMSISCPICDTLFQFNPKTFESTPMIKNPNKSEDSIKLSDEENLLILSEKQAIYPKHYIQFLSNISPDKEIKIYKGEISFKLYSLNELAKKLLINQQKTIRAKELSIYAQSLKEVGYEYLSVEGTSLQHSLEWLSGGLTIGHENTKILFLDKKLNLWIFYTDGTNDIRKTPLNLNDIIK